MVLLEFTIEPFVDGAPGPHVTAAVEAAEALGAAIEFGPFGSACRVAVERAAAVAGAVIQAALSNGATHVSLHAEQLGGSRG